VSGSKKAAFRGMRGTKVSGGKDERGKMSIMQLKKGMHGPKDERPSF